MRGLLVLVLMLLGSAPAFAAPARIVALGDSLTAGYGLKSGEDFATKLQEALIAAGHDVKIENAGVSGDTTAGGKSRLAWAIDGDVKPRLVIVALGANDMLRGLDPSVTKSNLSDILAELEKREIPALLVGMKGPTNLGPMFQGKFNKIYPDLANEYGVPLYPFFLEGVAMNSTLNLEDGIHPNTAGIAVIVKNILPTVEEALED